jgi:hypothetical protein
MRPIFLIMVLGFFWAPALTSPAFAQSPPPAHEHGAAQLHVFIEGDEVELSLESPLINFISFERAPNSPVETEEVKKMGETLSAVADLFVLSSAAGCQVKGVRLNSEAIDPALLPTPVWPAESGDDHNEETERDRGQGDTADHDHGDHDHGEHGDLLADYLFECQKPTELKAIDVRLFDKFPSLTRVDAQIITDGGQKAVTLDGRNAQIKW